MHRAIWRFQSRTEGEGREGGRVEAKAQSDDEDSRGSRMVRGSDVMMIMAIDERRACA